MTPYYWLRENLESGRSGLGAKVGLGQSKRVWGVNCFRNQLYSYFRKAVMDGDL